jgi:hypothetical protein
MKNNLLLISIVNVIILAVVTTSNSGCKGCNNTLDAALKKAVIFKYDHVANVHEIRFLAPIPVPGTFGVNSVAPKEGGFWAVFVICSLDVQGKQIESFNYDISHFAVEYEGQTFGYPLQPFTVRFEAGTALNDASNTPLIMNGIAKETQLGPSTQIFPRGLYPSLNYRVAILIPSSLSTYRGEQLTLKYTGQPSILQGSGNRPADISVLNFNAGTLPTTCRAFLQ